MVRTSLILFEDQLKWIKESQINLSLLVRTSIDNNPDYQTFIKEKKK